MKTLNPTKEFISFGEIEIKNAENDQKSFQYFDRGC